jgi:hypothetical protein
MREEVMLCRNARRTGFAYFISLSAVSVAIVGLTAWPAAAQERASFNRSSEGLYEIQGGPLNGDRVDLEGRYKAFAYATRDAEGNVHVECLDEHPHDVSQEEAAE